MARIETISPETYAIERAICDKAHAYGESIMAPQGKRVRNYLTAAEAAHPDYVACDNAMRGRVEQFEILRDLPETVFAYIGQPNRNGMGVDRILGQTYPVTVWTGLPIGFATMGSQWRVNSHLGSHMAQFYARIGGREYTGRGFGSGMCIALRETAESKRARNAAIAA